MTEPRYMPLEFAYHATRKTRDNLPFFPPTEDIIQAAKFIMAVGRNRFFVGLSGFAVMANHGHLIPFDRDPFSDHPNRANDFVQFVRSNLSLYAKEKWGIDGTKYDPDSDPQCIPIADVEGELWTTAYVNANPVDAGIAHDPYLPGIVGHPDLFVEGEVIERPDKWFTSRSWPDRATLKLDVPPHAHRAGYTAEAWRDEVLAATEKLASRIRLERKLEGLGYIGCVRARQLHPKNGPISDKKAGYSKIVVTGESKEKKAKFYDDDRAFRRRYRAASRELKDGRKDVIFPYGTSKLKRTTGVRTRTSPNPPDVAKWLAVHYCHPPP